jgi:ribonuclease R
MTEDHRASILQLMKDRPGEPVHFQQLVRHLDVPSHEHASVRRILRELEGSGVLRRMRGKTFRLEQEKLFLQGKFTLTKDGFGFVAIAEEPGRDVFIPKEYTGGALTGDVVRVREEWNARGRRMGAVVEVVERATRRVVGVLEQKGKSYYVRSTDYALPEPLWVDPSQLGAAVPGDEVGAEILVYPSASQHRAQGRVVHRFDSAEAVPGLIERIIFRSELSPEFPADVLAQAGALGEEVDPAEAARREDWRIYPLVTIDGEDAKDFDDAVAVVPAPDGRGVDVLVAIADVAHYVPIDSPIDREARRRGTSVYFPGRVLPMLPEALSNHLCSLKPAVPRLAVGTRVRLDNRFQIVSASFHDVVIHSRARLTYGSVQRMLDGAPGEKPPEELWDMLRALDAIAEKLRAARAQAGSLDLEIPEPAFRLTEDGQDVAAVTSRSRTRATGLIEELMLLANRAVAHAFLDAEIPAVFRIHEEPNDEKLRRFLLVARPNNEPAPGEVTRSTEVQRALQACEDADKRRVLQSLLLRAMQRARYSVDNAGHYGLAFEAYAHTTSPIRRYPDLVVQRLMKQFLRMGRRPAQPSERLRTTLADISVETTRLEHLAQKAEWDVDAALKALFARNHLGEVYDGVISALSANGIFVALRDLPIDGYLPILSLPPDDYGFNERLLVLTGRRTRATYELGGRLRVRIAAAEPLAGRVEFAVADDNKVVKAGRRPERVKAGDGRAPLRRQRG